VEGSRDRRGIGSASINGTRDITQFAGFDKGYFAMARNKSRCFIGGDIGWRYMGYVDKMPEAVRKRLANSRYNICAACVTEEMNGRDGVKNEEAWFKVIEYFEKRIEDEEDEG
jgi:hypothetical protein